MELKYYGHSCFTIKSNGYTVAIDPYDSMVPGYPKLQLEANAVYCSHGHGDHCYTKAVQIIKAACADPFKITEIEVPHDHHDGAKRGKNLIRIFEAEGKKVIHFGDTGCIPPDEILEQLKNADVILIPVGGFYTIDAKEAKDIALRVKPELVIPMHYKKGKLGLPVIAKPDVFLKNCRDSGLNIKLMEYLEEISI